MIVFLNYKKKAESCGFEPASVCCVTASVIRPGWLVCCMAATSIDTVLIICQSLGKIHVPLVV